MCIPGLVQYSVNVVSVKRLRRNAAIPVIHSYVVAGVSRVGGGVVSHLRTDDDRGQPLKIVKILDIYSII